MGGWVEDGASVLFFASVARWPTPRQKRVSPASVVGLWGFDSMISELPASSDPQPKLARAWVCFGRLVPRVEAVVVKWNDVACGIRFTVGDRDMECAVQANAVSPLD